MRTYRLFMVALIGVLLATLAMADELTLVDVIQFPVEDAEDTVTIRSIMPIGDFNADGYDDLLVGFKQKINDDLLEAAYLYYGGPDFDNTPDLMFNGEVNNENCDDYTAYGGVISDLGDFNNDGYDDIAISACAMCTNTYYNGRIYFYYGSPDPDTIPDFILNGLGDYDLFGYDMYGGDYNGDGIGDILTMTIDTFYGQKVYIYTGSDTPDDSYDFIADYSYQEVEVLDLFGGDDINGDGYDDFGWGLNSSTLLFLGDMYLDEEPDYIFDQYSCYLRTVGDVSMDGEIDYMMFKPAGYYLYLGGSQFDTIPDYFLGVSITENSFTCNIAPDSSRLVAIDDYDNQLLVYNIGVPVDTVPCAVYDFYYDRFLYLSPNISDINYDGYNEFAFVYRDDSLRNKIYIYSIEGNNGIGDNDISSLPHETSVITSYPNPFNSSTILSYSSIEGGELRVYDIAGRLVKTLACESDQGNVTWDGTNMSGEKLSSGVYFAKAAKGEHNITTKLVYLK